jgi:ribosomal protein S18 acetylase RimI-like enzyme
VRVRLVRVDDGSLGDFLEFFDDYRHELDEYSTSEPDVLPIGRYGEAIQQDPGAQELLWVVADDDRAGFLIVREFDDWPDTARTVLDIAECYVAPQFRRQGVGKAAIEALLDRERRRGTALIEASVLYRNEPAIAFWKSLGFTVRSIRTAREP